VKQEQLARQQASLHAALDTALTRFVRCAIELDAAAAAEPGSTAAQPVEEGPNGAEDVEMRPEGEKPTGAYCDISHCMQCGRRCLRTCLQAMSFLPVCLQL
jgi:hypothetical protein